MNFTIATHNEAKNPSNFIHYDTVEFSDIPQMVTSGYCYCACKLVNNYRLDGNFSGCVDVLIVDVDENCTIAQAEILFHKYEYFIITSKSHQKNKGGYICDRFRLFLQLDKTIHDRKDMEEVYSNFIINHPFIDVKCRNVSRFYYSSPQDAIVSYNEGRSYKTKVVNSVNSMGVETTKTENVTPSISDDVYKLNELTNKWVTDSGDELDCSSSNEENHLLGITTFLDSDFYQGNKGHCLFQAGCMMVKDNFDDDFIVNFLSKEWESRSSSTDKFKDMLQNVKGSLKTR